MCPTLVEDTISCNFSTFFTPIYLSIFAGLKTLLVILSLLCCCVRIPSSSHARFLPPATRRKLMFLFLLIYFFLRSSPGSLMAEKSKRKGETSLDRKLKRLKREVPDSDLVTNKEDASSSAADDHSTTTNNETSALV